MASHSKLPRPDPSRLLARPTLPADDVAVLLRCGVPQMDDSMALKHEFMYKFHNISRIMDCVGCEKCKVGWFVG